MIGGAGKEPDPYMFGSAITNSALLNMTKSLSTEFGPDNVMVNAVCPGWVATALWRQHADGLQRELGVKDEEEARRLAAKKNALGRIGKTFGAGANPDAGGCRCQPEDQAPLDRRADWPVRLRQVHAS